MEQKFKRSEIIGCIFAWVIGTLLHMLYDWTNQNQLVGLFSPVNESVWEHLKMIFFPIVIYSIFQYFYIGKEIPNYFTAKLLGILSGILVVIVGFYGTILVWGKPVTWIDISLFFIAIAAAYLVSYKTIQKFKGSEAIEILCFLIILLIIVLFWAFTYYPPDFFLFNEIKS